MNAAIDTGQAALVGSIVIPGPLQGDIDTGSIFKYQEFVFGRCKSSHTPRKELVTCQAHQIYYNNGSRIIGGIVHYLKERKENFNRWSRTLFTFDAAPMTLIWGEQDPVAVIAMADRIKKERPVTDLYKYPDMGHWPSVEYPDRIGDAVIARLGSV